MKKEKKETKTAAPRLNFGKKTRIVMFSSLWLMALSPIFLVTYLFMSQPEEELPSLEFLENPPELQASIVYADDGKTELGRYWSVNRSSVAYKDISPFVIDALISTEDERFMEHAGIDFRAVMRAAFSFGGAGGASTITQQLAKLIFTLQARERRDDLRAQGKVEPRGESTKWSRIQGRIDEKVKENIIAVRLESRYTKEEIVTMYLNQFDFLYNAVGIKNASKVYFNKEPSKLTKSEAAMLVGMCKNPSMYNPYTYKSRDYRSDIAAKKDIKPENVKEKEILELRTADSLRAHERRNQVLFQWLKNSKSNNQALRTKITQAEYDKLIKEEIKTDYQLVDHKQGLAPYFRETLRRDLTKMFAMKKPDGSYVYHKKDGKPYNVYEDGLKIYTTINVELQEYAEAAVEEHLRRDLQPAFTKNNNRTKNFPFANRVSDDQIDLLMNSGRKQSERYRKMKEAGKGDQEILKSFSMKVPMTVFSWKGEFDTIMTPNDSIRYYKNLLRAGLISIEPSTGFVKAYVGGPNFKHFAYDMVQQGHRQVGSTIKPFVYATAILMDRVKPCTKFESGTSYCVDVYDEEGYMSEQWCPEGEIKTQNGQSPTVAWGLKASSNPVTVAVMSRMGGYSGPKTISKLLSGMNINLRKEDEVPSMCLGIMDLSPFQMVGAQAMFVNQGMFVKPSYILRIEDRNGNIIFTNEPEMREVLPPYVAYTVLDMMKGVISGGTAARIRATPGERYPWTGLTMPFAGKTGTTQNNSDGWFCGLTPDLVTSIWVGAEDRAVRFRSMDWGQGARMALPIYGYYMKKAYASKKLKLSQEDFEIPVGYDPLMYGCSGDVNDRPPIDIGL